MKKASQPVELTDIEMAHVAGGTKAGVQTADYYVLSRTGTGLDPSGLNSNPSPVGFVGIGVATAYFAQHQ